MSRLLTLHRNRFNGPAGINSPDAFWPFTVDGVDIVGGKTFTATGFTPIYGANGVDLDCDDGVDDHYECADGIFYDAETFIAFVVANPNVITGARSLLCVTDGSSSAPSKDHWSWVMGYSGGAGSVFVTDYISTTATNSGNAIATYNLAVGRADFHAISYDATTNDLRSYHYDTSGGGTAYYEEELNFAEMEISSDRELRIPWRGGYGLDAIYRDLGFISGQALTTQAEFDTLREWVLANPGQTW